MPDSSVVSYSTTARRLPLADESARVAFQNRRRPAPSLRRREYNKPRRLPVLSLARRASLLQGRPSLVLYRAAPSPGRCGLFRKMASPVVQRSHGAGHYHLVNAPTIHLASEVPEDCRACSPGAAAAAGRAAHRRAACKSAHLIRKLNAVDVGISYSPRRESQHV